MSERQILANRANARLSTGPRSNNGKSTSAKNAVKHGLSRKPLDQWQAANAFNDCKADLLETESCAHKLFTRLQDQTEIDKSHPRSTQQAILEISTTIRALEMLERYRTPRLRAWLEHIVSARS